MRSRSRRGFLGLGAGVVVGAGVSAIPAAGTPAGRAPLPGYSSVTTFGAVGDGKTDDTAAINAALATGGGVYLPAGTYQVSGLTATVDGTHLYGDGPLTVLRKNADGAVLTLRAGRVSVSNLTVDGVGGSFAGPGVVSIGIVPHITDVEVRESRGPALQFPTCGAGHSAMVSDSIFSVWQGMLGQANQNTPSVWLPNDSLPTVQASNRQFLNLQAMACVLFSDAGSENSKWVGCTGRNLVITGRPGKLLMSSCRIATSGPSTTLAGVQCAFSGNAFAGDVVLKTTVSTFVGNILAGRLTIAAGATGTLAGFNSCANGVVDQR